LRLEFSCQQRDKIWQFFIPQTKSGGFGKFQSKSDGFMLLTRSEMKN
jgi:hypothetical protein